MSSDSSIGSNSSSGRRVGTRLTTSPYRTINARQRLAVAQGRSSLSRPVIPSLTDSQRFIGRPPIYPNHLRISDSVSDSQISQATIDPFSMNRSENSLSQSNEPLEVPPCSICFEDLRVGMVKTLQCGHPFHDRCVDQHFQTSRRQLCPICHHPHIANDDTDDDVIIGFNQEAVAQPATIEVRAQSRASNQEGVAQPASGLHSARRAAATQASARRPRPPRLSSGRGTNLSTEETQYMLGLVESHLPIHTKNGFPYPTSSTRISEEQVIYVVS